MNAVIHIKALRVRILYQFHYRLVYTILELWVWKWLVVWKHVIKTCSRVSWPPQLSEQVVTAWIGRALFFVRRKLTEFWSKDELNIPVIGEKQLGYLHGLLATSQILWLDNVCNEKFE